MVMIVTINISNHPDGYVAHAYRPGKSGNDWCASSWGATIQEAEDRCKENFNGEYVRFKVNGGIQYR